MGTSIYYEDLIGKEWLDYTRSVRRKPMVSLDFLVDDVMASRKPLDYEAILSSKVPLYVVATEVAHFAPRILGDFVDATELREALRATARIPIVSGRQVAFRGESFIDGSVSQSIPASSAVNILGASHVLALLTRPKGSLRSTPRLARRLGMFAAMNRWLPGLGDAHSQRPARYIEELAFLESLRASDRAHIVQLSAVVSPVAQLEQDPNALYKGALAGARAVLESLTGHDAVGYDGLAPLSAATYS
jgi:predicted patatin/cPLA2 family phospholipase